MDITVPEVSHQSLMEERVIAVGEPVPDQELNHMMEEARKSIESGRDWNREFQEQAPANIKAMMHLIESALKAKDAEVPSTKSLLNGSLCIASHSVGMGCTRRCVMCFRCDHVEVRCIGVEYLLEC